MTLPLPDPLVDQREWGEERTGVQRNFEALAQRFPLGPDDLHFGGTVTTLPTGVDEGWEVDYVASASTGVVWRLKYLPSLSAAYPWHYKGGPPLFAEVEADQGTGSTTYVDLASAGPSVALPLAGDYMVGHGFNGYNTNAAAQGMNMSYAIGATAAVDADALEPFVPAGSGPGRGNWSRERRKTGLGAVTLTAKYRVTVGANGQFFDRWMNVTPIRVA